MWKALTEQPGQSLGQNIPPVKLDHEGPLAQGLLHRQGIILQRHLHDGVTRID